jgi:hypothetical protein
VRKALLVFAGEVSAHQRGRCTAVSAAPCLPLPAGWAAREPAGADRARG